MERVMGIEPTQPAWKAGVLPLNYTRIRLIPSETYHTTRNPRMSRGFFTDCYSFISFVIRKGVIRQR